MNLKICKKRKRDVTSENEREHACVVKSHQCYVAETEAVVVGWLLDLPTHIIYEILSRLPMKTIYSCRCVCKTFLKIVKDPYFAKLHSKAPNVDHSLILHDLVNSDSFLAYTSDLENPSGFSWRGFNILPFPLYPKAHSLYCIGGSCNGLLLCHATFKTHKPILFVCNPVLGEFVILPHIRDDNMSYCGAIAFCTKTKLYKVIRFLGMGMGCEIHTLGTNDWRLIENAPSPSNRAVIDFSLNGNLHWTTTTTSKSNLICAMNLETEQPHYISPPSHILEDTMNRISYLRVGALDGLLCVYYLLDKAQLEVCVMKEYGVGSSWTKKFTVDLNFDFLQQPGASLNPMKLFNNGDLLVYFNYNSLIYCNFRKKIFKKLSSGITFDAVLYAPCFISLREIAGDMKVFQRDESSWEIRKCACGVDLFTAASLLTSLDVVPNTPQRQKTWLEEEFQRLVQAIPLTSAFSEITWDSVAAEVVTRTPFECRLKWLSIRKVVLV